MATYEGKTFPEKPQLIIRWPRSRLEKRLPQTIEDGYSIRTYQPGDEQRFLELMEFGAFDPWDVDKLRYNLNRAIPQGWFFVVHTKPQLPVATVMCLHNYSEDTPFCGDIGWLACDPKHRGKGLGVQIMSWATNRFWEAGYSAIQLKTEFYRLPAIKTSITNGEKICGKLWRRGD
jgi:GNAT superfamily N-acetyltransferase